MPEYGDNPEEIGEAVEQKQERTEQREDISDFEEKIAKKTDAIMLFGVTERQMSVVEILEYNVPNGEKIGNFPGVGSVNDPDLNVYFLNIGGIEYRATDKELLRKIALMEAQRAVKADARVEEIMAGAKNEGDGFVVKLDGRYFTGLTKDQLERRTRNWVENKGTKQRDGSISFHELGPFGNAHGQFERDFLKKEHIENTSQEFLAGRLPMIGSGTESIENYIKGIPTLSADEINELIEATEKNIVVLIEKNKSPEAKALDGYNKVRMLKVAETLAFAQAFILVALVLYFNTSDHQTVTQSALHGLFNITLDLDGVPGPGFDTAKDTTFLVMMSETLAMAFAPILAELPLIGRARSNANSRLINSYAKSRFANS